MDKQDKERLEEIWRELKHYFPQENDEELDLQMILDDPDKLKELIDIAEIEALIIASATRPSCPPAEDLLMLAEGFVDLERKVQLTEHLKSCGECRLEFAQIEAVELTDSDIAFLASVENSTEPRKWIDEMIQRGRMVIEAILQPPAEPKLALRGGPTSQKTYIAGDYHLVIATSHEYGDKTRYEVEGQLLKDHMPIEGEVARLVIREGRKPIFEADLNEYGMFLMNHVVKGSYSINISLEKTEIVIPEIQFP